MTTVEYSGIIDSCPIGRFLDYQLYSAFKNTKMLPVDETRNLALIWEAFY
jgi:hypothetical protein